VIDGVLYDDEFVSWCLLVLNDEQTGAERGLRKTIEGNSVGFSKANASYFGRLADKLLAGKPLSQGEFEYCREVLKSGVPRLAKYRGQLLRALNDRVPESSGDSSEWTSEVQQ
jgi:hypothetical protein